MAVNVPENVDEVPTAKLLWLLPLNGMTPKNRFVESDCILLCVYKMFHSKRLQPLFAKATPSDVGKNVYDTSSKKMHVLMR